MKVSKSDQQAAVERLRSILTPGDTVYTVLRSVSRSGMSRTIDLYAIQDNKPRYLSGRAANACGWNRTAQGAVKVNGCGMDMGFHLVCNLSMQLFCPDNYDQEAAYALKHSWL